MSEARLPEVSVLLPARDAEATIGAALRSCLRQREVYLEVLVVDDGSRDGTARIAAEAAARDPRVRLLRMPARGLVPALGEGLAACRAPLVARMDADDWMHRDRLARQRSVLASDPTLSGVGCHVRIFPRATLGEGRRAYERWLNAIDSAEAVARDAFIECPLAHPGLLLRRSVLDAFGWRDFGWPEDYDLLLRLLGAGHRLGVVPRRLLGWRNAPGRLSQRSSVYTVERFTACKAHFLAEGFLADRSTYVLCGYGGTGRALRRALARHGKEPSHIIDVHPGRRGQRIHGARVLSPEALRGLHGAAILVSVAGAERRGQIRGLLNEMGFRERIDYVCTA